MLFLIGMPLWALMQCCNLYPLWFALLTPPWFQSSQPKPQAKKEDVTPMNSTAMALETIGDYFLTEVSSTGVTTAARTKAAAGALSKQLSVPSAEPSSKDGVGSKALAFVATAPGTAEPLLDEGFFALMKVSQCPGSH